jgi:adenylylsulfate kinase
VREKKATNIHWHSALITREQRYKNLNCNGCTLWLTGLPASGKSTLASALELYLIKSGIHAYRLDGDNIRHGLNNNLGFSRDDRSENIRRIGEVAKLFADSGCVAITAFISPYITDRDNIRRLHQESDCSFFEVFVDAPIEVCEQRDPKEQYKKARAGLIKGFTGVDDPYEPPIKPELVLKTAELSVEKCILELRELLSQNKIIRRHKN